MRQNRTHRTRSSRSQLARRYSRAPQVLAATVLATATIAGCSASGGGSSGGSGGGNSNAVLNVAPNPSGPFISTFNPFLPTSTGASGSVDHVIYAPLYMLNPVTATYQPWLATSYKWGNSGKTLSMTIRNGLRWSDGTPLTASDVAYTFNLMKNNPALNTGGLPLVSATAPNATTVVMTFTTPAYSYVTPIITTKPVPKHIWEHQKNPATFADSRPVGSGPYVLRNFTPQAITLVKNPHFWQAGKVKVKTMRYVAFDSPSSVQAALESGQIDLEDHVFTDFNKLISHPGLGGLLIHSGTVQLLLNEARYPLNILAVRQAINDALDRPAITKQGLGGLQAPEKSRTGLPPALAHDIAPAYEHLTYGPADPAKAKAGLVKAGFKLGADGIFRTPKGTPLNLTMILGAEQANLQSAAQVMKGQLKAAGIGLNIQTEHYPAVHSAVLQGKFDLNILANQQYSAYDFYRMMLDTREYKPVGKRAAYDLVRFQDPAASAAYKTWAMNKPGSPAAIKARDEIEKIMVNEVPSVPLFSSSPQGAYNTQHFTGWPTKANPYCIPEVIGDDAELLMTHVRPK